MSSRINFLVMLDKKNKLNKVKIIKNKNNNVIVLA
jgi:hypothetical protein